MQCKNLAKLGRNKQILTRPGLHRDTPKAENFTLHSLASNCLIGPLQVTLCVGTQTCQLFEIQLISPADKFMCRVVRFLLQKLNWM